MPTIQTADRISDCESMTDKLIYQIRTGQLTDTSLNALGARCTSELRELRQELDELLHELRQMAGERINDNKISRNIAA